MKANIRHWARDDNGKIVIIVITIKIPFVPNSGMSLKVTKDGTYLVLKNIYIDLNANILLDIFTVKTPHFQHLDCWIKQGWRKE